MLNQYVVYFQNGISGKRIAINKAVEQIKQLGVSTDNVQPYLGAVFIQATEEQLTQVSAMPDVQKVSPLC